jgi:predicted nucleic acid-binding protein
MNVAIDTNVLAYAEGLNDSAKRDIALSVLEALPPESTFLPVQTLGELFSVLVRKARRPAAAAAEAVLSWGDAFPLIESSGDVLLAATDLAQAHAVGFWDALIVSAAAEARCRLLLSEDLEDGFTWRGVTVANPFGAQTHPLLSALLTDATSLHRDDVEAGRRPGRSGTRAKRRRRRR